MSIRTLWFGTVLLALVAGLLSVPALASSHARVVRLSDVEGTVQIDRGTGQGYEKAIVNMPIEQGTKLWSKDDGKAEVEFEDGSVLRIVPNTKVEFSELSLADSGGKLSTVDLKEGTAYINYEGKKDDALTVNFAHESTRLTKPAHFRVEMDDTQAVVAVFKGDVHIEGQSGDVEVAKGHSVTFDLADNDKYEVAKNYEQDPYDRWDKQEEQYHDRYYSNNYGGGSYPYSYGVSDLNYYGNYYMVPGYGYMWQPFFTGVGWDPFMNGAWCWYPGYGYTFVSAYPWGWMPYRYGTWVFVPNFGWGWMPGGWTTWNTIPPVKNPPRAFTPPAAPASAGKATVIVGKPTVNGFGSTNPGRRVTITQGSAGMGIPRGTIRNLPAVAHRVETQGSATVRTAPPSAWGGWGARGAAAPRAVEPGGRMTGPRTAPAPHMSAPHSAPAPSGSKH
jgi:FecR protein